ncbi:MAG: hypothetical protein IKA57_06095, partial [Clostridia bacterium]|nr:hypothetical protein [Clostridia bacterium]
MKNKKNLLCALMLAGLLSASMTGCADLSDSVGSSNNSDTSINTESPTESPNESTGDESNSSGGGDTEITHK